MSKTDEMFEEIGYWFDKEDKNELVYVNDDDVVIKFDKRDKSIAIFNKYDGFEYFSIQELKAINKKVKELGWIEDE